MSEDASQHTHREPVEVPWRDLFYLYAFLDLTLSHRSIERREHVWIRRFLARRGHHALFRRMDEIVTIGRVDQVELQRLTERAERELSIGEKRHFVYNLAQLFESKGKLSASEYEKLLAVAGTIGVSDIDADSMIHSVYTLHETFIAIIGVLAAGAILYFTQAVFVPFVIAIFITMIIYQLERVIAQKLSIHRLRWLTKLGATVLVLVFFFGLVMVAIVSATDIVKRLPEFEEKFSLAMRDSSSVQRALGFLRSKGLLVQLQQIPIGSMLASFLASLISLVSNFVLVVVFTGFMVFSSSKFTGVMQEMTEKVGAYISVKTLMCLLIGALVTAQCAVFGIDFALFWGLLAFLLNYIPTVGAVIATLPLMLLAVVQLRSWTAIVLFLVILMLPQQLIGQVIEPKLMGKRLSVKPIAILLGLIFWGVLWGIPGMFLATPLMVLLRIVSSYFNVSRSFERLIATDTT